MNGIQGTRTQSTGHVGQSVGTGRKNCFHNGALSAVLRERVASGEPTRPTVAALQSRSLPGKSN